jgi:hypothetical protein
VVPSNGGCAVESKILRESSHTRSSILHSNESLHLRDSEDAADIICRARSFHLGLSPSQVAMLFRAVLNGRFLHPLSTLYDSRTTTNRKSRRVRKL